MATKIGIQGEFGSTNERAAKLFIEKHQVKDAEIVPLRTTKNVLEAINKGQVEYGTFAWESSGGGLVEETQAATKKYSYVKVDELSIQPQHVLFSPESIDKNSPVSVYSHPQALKEHRPFLQDFFPNCTLHEEEDTALAASRLSKGEYPRNSIAIADKSCAALFELQVIDVELPANKNYWTIIYLVKK
jgi:prephenate dehydratase